MTSITIRPRPPPALPIGIPPMPAPPPRPRKSSTWPLPVPLRHFMRGLIPAGPGSTPRHYTCPMAQAPVLPRGFELPLEPRLPRIGSVDAVALEERAATLAKRSIKRESKLQAFELAVRMMDLTTLEGAEIGRASCRERGGGQGGGG